MCVGLKRKDSEGVRVGRERRKEAFDSVDEQDAVFVGFEYHVCFRGVDAQRSDGNIDGVPS